MIDERKDRTMQNEQIQVGTRVSYEDMANPRREGTIVAELDNQLAVRWDDDMFGGPVKSAAFGDVAFHTTVTRHMLERAIERVAKAGGRSAGWNVIAVDPHDLELAPALLDELGVDERIKADAAELEDLLDRIEVDAVASAVEIAQALAVIVTTPTIRLFLEENDPKALEQARTALGVEPPVRRLGHVDAHTLMRAENTGLEVDGVSPTAATAELDRRGR